jgi:hypothetical protein
MVGAILASGQRTVTAAWRVRGLAPAQPFQPEQRVLHRAVWSSVKGSRLLLDRRRTPWPGGQGVGRYPGAPLGPDDPGQGDGSRSGALRPQSGGQQPRVALVEPAALGPHAVGPARLGLARRAGADPVRALPSGPWPAAPEAARRGPITAPGGTALGARASTGARPRAPLRRHNRAVAAASVGASPRWHHPCAGGCRPLCTGPTPPATAAWPAAPHGRAAADAGPSAAAAGPRLHHGDGTRLVGRRGAGGGDRRGYGGLVARRHAPPADPLGPRPRSARAVRALSTAHHEKLCKLA